MFLWWFVRWLAVVVQSILLPRWLCEGRVSRRLTLLLMLFLVAIEFLPATHPLKIETHAFYSAGAATVASRFDATWRLQAACSRGNGRTGCRT